MVQKQILTYNQMEYIKACENRFFLLKLHSRYIQDISCNKH